MIQAIITDMDGTLVDTFEANYGAYAKAFETCGQTLTKEQYRACFGLRYDRFMARMGYTDEALIRRIKELKTACYPEFFGLHRLNTTLISIIDTMRAKGVKTAIASTARKENLMKVLTYHKLTDHFDLILTAQDVKKSKPDPEIYIKAMDILGVDADSSLVFEDSDIGMQSGRDSGAKCIRVTEEWFR